MPFSVIKESRIDILGIDVSIDKVLQNKFTGFEVRSRVVVGFSMNQLQSFLQVLIPKHVFFEIRVFQQILLLIYTRIYLVLVGQFVGSCVTVHFETHNIIDLSLSFGEEKNQN